MAPRKPKDPALRKQDGLADEAETIERAMNSGFGKVKYSELYSALVVPPGKTTTQVSRKPGSSIPGGVPVANEHSGATHRIAGKGQEQFPTVNAGPVRDNVLSHDAFMASTHVRPGAGTDDPPVVVNPSDGQAEMPPWARDVVSYVADSHVTGRAPGVSVVESI